MYVGFVSLSISLIVSCMVVSSVPRIFWSLGSFCAILIFLSLLYMPYPAMSLGESSSFGFGGVNDPSV
jgi:hypothetical protein